MMTAISIPLINGVDLSFALSNERDASICRAKVERNTIVGLSELVSDHG